MEVSKRNYEGWTSKEWNRTIRSLNELRPPEKCGVELNEEERVAYLKDLEWLKKEREKNPGIPISYELVENDW